MIRLSAMRQPGTDCPPAGTLRSIDAPAKQAELRCEFSVEGLGGFRHSLRAPLYSVRALAAAGEEALGFAPSAESCLGCAADCAKTRAAYLTAQDGAYTYALPLYAPAEFSPLGWKKRGCLLTENGYAVVLTRRTGYWIGMGLLALLLCGAAYLCVTHGFAGAVEAVRNFFLDLYNLYIY